MIRFDSCVSSVVVCCCGWWWLTCMRGLRSELVVIVVVFCCYCWMDAFFTIGLSWWKNRIWSHSCLVRWAFWMFRWSRIRLFWFGDIKWCVCCSEQQCHVMCKQAWCVVLSVQTGQMTHDRRCDQLVFGSISSVCVCPPSIWWGRQWRFS